MKGHIFLKNLANFNYDDSVRWAWLFHPHFVEAHALKIKSHQAPPSQRCTSQSGYGSSLISLLSTPSSVEKIQWENDPLPIFATIS